MICDGGDLAAHTFDRMNEHQKIIAELTLLNAEKLNELTECFMQLVEHIRPVCPGLAENNQLSSVFEQMEATIAESNKRIKAYRAELFGS
jgi:hypothetical protein